MGARPTRGFVTLGLRRDARVADLEDLYGGFATLTGSLREAGFAFDIAGGDTVSSSVTMLSITVVGELAGEGLRRAAGQPGDLLAVTGTLGGSSGGLALLEQGGDLSGDDQDGATLADLHRRPQPRVAEGLVLSESGIRCGMDLSDGLLGDAGKLAYASDLCATLLIHHLPMPPALIRRFGQDAARKMALAGGEDFELLVAGDADILEAASQVLRDRDLQTLTIVGRLEAGPPGQVTVLDEHGKKVTPPRSSWDHFQQSESRV
jgi:thiamine-monophosphate kinase